MIVTTTPEIQGRTVTAYLGIIAGDAVLGGVAVGDRMADLLDVIGGRTTAYVRALAEARRLALEVLEERAADLAADAVVAVHLEERLVQADQKTMVMVSAYGTAVKLTAPGGG